MTQAIIEIHRGPIVESRHRVSAVVWREGHGIIGAWGRPQQRFLPRSSAKMIQALPLVESGAADRFRLDPARLALACASHQGAHIHTSVVSEWLTELGLEEGALRCGSQWPDDRTANNELIRAVERPDQRHNNCSGKHTGFLTLTKHLGAGPEYLEIDHPVQRAVSEAWDAVTDDTNAEYAIDGCSAPNFVTRLDALARAMAIFAAAQEGHSVRESAMVRLREAMMQNPELVAGEGRACTRLMCAMKGRAAVKFGAEGVFTAIVPEQKIGIAVKAEDGAARACEATIAALMVQLGVLDPQQGVAQALTMGPIRNWRGVETGFISLPSSLTAWVP